MFHCCEFGKGVLSTCTQIKVIFIPYLRRMMYVPPSLYLVICWTEVLAIILPVYLIIRSEVFNPFFDFSDSAMFPGEVSSSHDVQVTNNRLGLVLRSWSLLNSAGCKLRVNILDNLY